ncbi:unnamed protein product [Albugo candida]|uniref:Uncharacterized protein n=1 Tax=Albugo candida TaxID=65357 RepID=A0A024GGB7_9STRA|nr:unnamed protein product [Albugo candida]|eukprot:CCI45578.1 unnamed protein product [Albugo candida]
MKICTSEAGGEKILFDPYSREEVVKKDCPDFKRTYFGSVNARRNICSIGVIPVPPAIIPIFFAERISAFASVARRLIFNFPFPRYVNFPFGPDTSIVSPKLSDSSA